MVFEPYPSFAVMETMSLQSSGISLFSFSSFGVMSNDDDEVDGLETFVVEFIPAWSSHGASKNV